MTLCVIAWTLLLPHAAFSSVESLAELQRKAVEQVLIALAGDTPPYALNAQEVLAVRRDQRS